MMTGVIARAQKIFRYSDDDRVGFERSHRMGIATQAQTNLGYYEGNESFLNEE